MRDFPEAPQASAAVIEGPARGMLALRAALDAPGLDGDLVAVGLALPGPLSIRAGEAGQAAWMSPDELLILTEPGAAAALAEALAKALADHHHLVVDMTDARAAFTVTGPAARDVLARLTPMDIAPAAFPQGAFRRTRLAQIPAALWPEGEAFDVLCFASHAPYAGALLRNAARSAALSPQGR